MGIKGAVVTMILFAMTCSATAQSPAVGVVKVNRTGEWQLYSTRQITSLDKISIQTPGENDKAHCCANVTLDGGKRIQKELVVTDEMGDQEVWSYKLKPPPVNSMRPFIGIAIIGKLAHAHIHGVGSNVVHIEDDGKSLIVHSCLGVEGVNILARNGKKLTARLYLNLGYSVSSTCTDDMFE